MGGGGGDEAHDDKVGASDYTMMKAAISVAKISDMSFIDLASVFGEIIMILPSHSDLKPVQHT